MEPNTFNKPLTPEERERSADEVFAEVVDDMKALNKALESKPNDEKLKTYKALNEAIINSMFESASMGAVSSETTTDLAQSAQEVAQMQNLGSAAINVPAPAPVEAAPAAPVAPAPVEAAPSPVPTINQAEAAAMNTAAPTLDQSQAANPAGAKPAGGYIDSKGIVHSSIEELRETEEGYK